LDSASSSGTSNFAPKDDEKPIDAPNFDESMDDLPFLRNNLGDEESSLFYDVIKCYLWQTSSIYIIFLRCNNCTSDDNGK
jgi:hypothetical protein